MTPRSPSLWLTADTGNQEKRRVLGSDNGLSSAPETQMDKGPRVAGEAHQEGTPGEI